MQQPQAVLFAYCFFFCLVQFWCGERRGRAWAMSAWFWCWVLDARWRGWWRPETPNRGDDKCHVLCILPTPGRLRGREHAAVGQNKNDGTGWSGSSTKCKILWSVCFVSICCRDETTTVLKIARRQDVAMSRCRNVRTEVAPSGTDSQVVTICRQPSVIALLVKVCDGGRQV